jgi:hypothetical protein
MNAARIGRKKAGFRSLTIKKRKMVENRSVNLINPPETKINDPQTAGTLMSGLEVTEVILNRNSTKTEEELTVNRADTEKDLQEAVAMNLNIPNALIAVERIIMVKDHFRVNLPHQKALKEKITD